MASPPPNAPIQFTDRGEDDDAHKLIEKIKGRSYFNVLSAEFLSKLAYDRSDKELIMIDQNFWDQWIIQEKLIINNYNDIGALRITSGFFLNDLKKVVETVDAMSLKIEKLETEIRTLKRRKVEKKNFGTPKERR